MPTTCRRRRRTTTTATPVASPLLTVVGILFALLSIHCASVPASAFAPRSHRKGNIPALSRYAPSHLSPGTVARSSPILFDSPSASSFAKDSNDDASSSDPFDSYVAGTSTDVAIRDRIVGTGEEARPGDVVTVKYEGRLLSDGRPFDSGTFSFKLGSGTVIPGWERGIEGCRVGGTRTLRIPPSLAYGDRGVGGDDQIIPPGSDLEFDCEVVKVANGPVAEVVAALGLGMNLRTLWIVGMVLTILLPRLGLMEKGFI